MLKLPVTNTNSQQMEFDYVQLDDLVLENCASLLKCCFDRIKMEPTSQRFANHLHSTFSRQYVSLSLDITKCRDPATRATYSSFRWRLNKMDTKRRTSGNRNVKCSKNVVGNNFDEILKGILSRFKKFSTMTIQSTYNTEFPLANFLKIIASENCRPKQIVNLCLQTQVFSITNGILTLLEQFGPQLKSLTLQCEVPTRADLSKQLWTAVASCTKLKSLNVSPSNNRSNHIFTQSQDLLDCLKVLKIRRYQSNLSRRPYDSTWLQSAFNDNENLHSLFLTGNNSDRLEMFAQPPLLSIISKLRTFGIAFTAEECPQRQAVHIEKILYAVPDNGYLIVMQMIGGESEEDDLLPNPNVNRVLQFWLDLLDLTARTIKLTLNCSGVKEGHTHRIIDAIKQTCKYYCSLIVEKKKTYTMLRNGTGKIVLFLSENEDNE